MSFKNRILNFFTRRTEKREAGGAVDPGSVADMLFMKFLRGEGAVTRQEALNIPSVYGGIKLICGLVSMLPVYLYEVKDGKKRRVEQDARVRLLNDDTGELMDGVQLKSALIEDYLLDGRGYAFVKRRGNTVKSLHYIPSEQITVETNDTNPIARTATVRVGGRAYEPYQFIRLLNGSRDGVSGAGLLSRCEKLLDVAYSMLDYEGILAKSGGNKKGFLQSENKLTKPEMDELRAKWEELFKLYTSSVMVLNKGITFKDAASTAVEMQMNESKQSNSVEACKLLNIPPMLLSGAPTEETVRLFEQTCLAPLLTAMESAYNRSLLLEREKAELYFAVDTKNLFKTDLLKRWQAYEVAVRGGIMQPDEIRFMEDLPALGFNKLRLGLQDVYYDPGTDMIYTPNTGQAYKFGEPQGENTNDDGTKEAKN